MGSGRKVCVWFLANCEVQLCSTLAALSILGVVVVCPVMLDPAIDTLVSSFEEGMCQTVYNQYLQGLSNCTWTSCREGCTADIFSCYHIIVVYIRGSSEEFDAYHKRANEEEADEELQELNNVLQSSSPLPEDLSLASSSSLVSHFLPSASAKLGDGDPSRLKTSDLTRIRRNVANKKQWILPPDHDYEVYEYNNSFIRNIDSNLKLMMEQIHRNLDIQSLSGSVVNVTETKMLLGIGAILPNPQGCVYPSEILCSEFRRLYGRVGGDVFPCYISTSNRTMVVTRVDKAGAVRNIFYSFLPLIAASGVFTYLFYRVGLIGRRRRRRNKTGDEESGALSDDGTPQKSDSKNASLVNGAPPVVRKKMRKKFLPKKDSSKKRRKGKLFDKKNLLSLKTQLSVKSPSPSRRTNSMSMAGASITDDSYTLAVASNSYMNNNRTSVQLI
jgi:hypothetical protein